ncbi:MAG: M28 family peptidase [Campylobacterota bacterium]
MQEYLRHFNQLTKIPRCSKETTKAKEYILQCAKKYGYDIQVDAASNILLTTRGSQITLQSHYDMVCMGKAPEIELIKDNDILSAKESSLGADNGMGCAFMLAFMEQGYKVDCLFTNDEEVGLIGARELDVDIKTDKMLNLDSEEYGKIYLGCAGGVDLHMYKDNVYVNSLYKRCFEVTVQSDGGHSGIDIDKPIPNAIVSIAQFLDGQKLDLVAFKGGERMNAIASYSKAIVRADTLQSTDLIKVIEIHPQTNRVLANAAELINKIATYQNGVITYDKSINSVIDSANFALIDNNSFSVSLRSMTNEGLHTITQSTKEHFSDFAVQQSDFYSPWEPKITEFAKNVQKVYDNAEFAAIHAGLECAVINEKYPHLEIVSIGPDIYYPHSIKEKCNLESCEKIFKLIKTLL